jgi:hypothetical protein
MCYLDIALSNDMTDEAIDIIQRYRYSVFGRCNHTKNRGACVNDEIWLASFTNLIAVGIGVQLKLQIRNMFSAEDKYGNTSMMEFLLRQQRGKEEIWSGEYLR